MDRFFCEISKLNLPFDALCITACSLAKLPVIICEEEGAKSYPMYTSTLLSIRISSTSDYSETIKIS